MLNRLSPILAAPPNLCLAAYLSFVDEPSKALVFVFLGLAIPMSAWVYLCLIKLVRLPFSPGFAGFTFPLVIGATASIKACVFLKQQVVNDFWLSLLQLVATAQLYIACAMVCYVIFRYLQFYKLLPKSAYRYRRFKGTKV